MSPDLLAPQLCLGASGRSTGGADTVMQLADSSIQPSGHATPRSWVQEDGFCLEHREGLAAGASPIQS